LKHLFDTQSLGTKLDAIAINPFGLPPLVFDRVRKPPAFKPREAGTVLPFSDTPKLHHVGTPGQPQAQTPQRDASSDLEVTSSLRVSAVHAFVKHPTLRSKLVLAPCSFHMD